MKGSKKLQRQTAALSTLQLCSQLPLALPSCQVLANSLLLAPVSLPLATLRVIGGEAKS